MSELEEKFKEATRITVTHKDANIALAGMGVVVTMNPGTGLPDFVLAMRNLLIKEFPDQVPYNHDLSDNFAELELTLGQINAMVTCAAALAAANQVGLVEECPHTTDEIIGAGDRWYQVILDRVPELADHDRQEG